MPPSPTITVMALYLLCPSCRPATRNDPPGTPVPCSQVGLVLSCCCEELLNGKMLNMGHHGCRQVLEDDSAVEIYFILWQKNNIPSLVCEVDSLSFEAHTGIDEDLYRDDHVRPTSLYGKRWGPTMLKSKRRFGNTYDPHANWRWPIKACRRQIPFYHSTIFP